MIFFEAFKAEMSLSMTASTSPFLMCGITLLQGPY